MSAEKGIYMINVDTKTITAAMTENFLRIDARMGSQPRVEYTGERLVTPNLGLVIPAQNDYPWGHFISENFFKIDAALATLLNREYPPNATMTITKKGEA